ncbi:MAG TPA: tetratricopeptide repeat protein [Polyangiaceae bacterium]|jgi:hypothetical protein|nr:tetratricopeptide repeat protein [Polyangiaceae bacterium]
MGAKSVRATDDSPVEMSVPGGVAPPEDVTLPGIGPLEGSRDEGSVPPMGDLDSRFFEMASDAFESTDPAPRRPLRRLQGAAAERRERFVRLVAGAVALSAVLCGAALVKRAVATEMGPEERAGAPGRAFAVAAAVAPVAPTVAPVAPLAPVAPAAAPALPTPAPASVTPAALPPDLPAAESGLASALEERGVSRDALEHRKIALSIEAGERSVALDPTDAEAWLVLGAAYQERGQLGEARRCYKTCLVKATWGPRTECRQLLR